MTIETSTYISQLNSAYPEAGSAFTEGDDHIRKIKDNIKATFPNFTGIACTPTSVQVNYLSSVTSDIQTQLNAKADATYVAGAVGTYVFAQSSGSAVNFNNTIAGSSLKPVQIAAGGTQTTNGVPLSGTWVCMGYNLNSTTASLFLRFV